MKLSAKKAFPLSIRWSSCLYKESPADILIVYINETIFPAEIKDQNMASFK